MVCHQQSMMRGHGFSWPGLRQYLRGTWPPSLGQWVSRVSGMGGVVDGLDFSSERVLSVGLDMGIGSLVRRTTAIRGLKRFGVFGVSIAPFPTGS